VVSPLASAPKRPSRWEARVGDRESIAVRISEEHVVDEHAGDGHEPAPPAAPGEGEVEPGVAARRAPAWPQFPHPARPSRMRAAPRHCAMRSVPRSVTGPLAGIGQYRPRSCSYPAPARSACAGAPLPPPRRGLRAATFDITDAAMSNRRGRKERAFARSPKACHAARGRACGVPCGPRRLRSLRGLLRLAVLGHAFGGASGEPGTTAAFGRSV
jgi:hypothetical protein